MYVVLKYKFSIQMFNPPGCLLKCWGFRLNGAIWAIGYWFFRWNELLNPKPELAVNISNHDQSFRI